MWCHVVVLDHETLKGCLLYMESCRVREREREGVRETEREREREREKE